ncbi:hypothetical protein AALT_g9417 [Alternaria alternata]|nr:hypothetical protein AALT_g9417 [Alternaria alternata]
MLQSYPESPVSPSTSQGVIGSAADPVLVSNSAAQAQSNATSPPPPATRKSRVALACKRCKRRKQRCDGARPVCRSCQRAGVACAYERTIRPQYPGGKSVYINALEERIAFLEARLPDHAEDHYDNGPESLQNTSSMNVEEPALVLQPQPSASRRESREECFSEDLEGEDRTSLIDGVAYLSLCASGTTDTTSEPYYVGSSSGATIARIIQSSIFRSSGKRAVTQPVSQTCQATGTSRPPAPPESTHSEETGPDFPDRQQAPTEPMDYILDQHNLATVQFLILLGVHGQRSPYGAGAWSQIRFATSVCIEMGLHRKKTVMDSPAHARDAEIRRRNFWACYCLDRVTSIVLGRAFAIADRDINVELPSTSPEFYTLTHSEVPDSGKAQWSNIEPFIHIIKLDQIQSRIHKAVFRVDRDVFNGTPEQRAKLDRKMAAIRSDLDEWLRTYPQTPKKENKITWMYDPESAYLDARDFYGVQYHKAMLFLFTVFLPTLDTSDMRFITCARSAACVCNAYKRLSQNRTLTYTMISLHSCFVAGLTLVYCIWRDRSLFSYDVLEATRACSQILTIFGEKWPGAVKYRDIFDALSGSLFKTIVNSTPTTTMHGNGSRPLQLDMDAEPGITPRSRRESREQASHLPTYSNKPTMSHMVTDAVKEAFMEVDEEAPGGWQGWRMFNEMVSDDTTSAASAAMRFDGVSQNQTEMSWDAYDGSGFYGVDPIQDAAMQMDTRGMVDGSQWNFGEYR